ncbi:MAG: hypothetical protein Q9182_004369 [Xanthomendoza sp. 2 TL-2023]
MQGPPAGTDLSATQVPRILGANIATFCLAILVTILQCQPVSDFWNRYSPDAKGPFQCGVNVNQFFDGNAVPNIVTDAAILVLPIPFIWRLHLPKAQKLGLISIFMLGIFVIGISIARFAYIVNLNLVSPDITWNFVNVQIWTGLESHVGVICDEGSYILNRKYAATTRLNSQHLLWKLELGWCLHPSFQALTAENQISASTAPPNVSAATVMSSIQDLNPSMAQPENFRIADLATGTAIWAIDASYNFSLAYTDVFDINL